MKEPDHNDFDGPPAWHSAAHGRPGLRGANTSLYKMKTRPKHLPPHKQQQLREIVEAIRARHDVEMIILFGSHARGDWVEDRYIEDHITYEYRSDYDILIITADKDSERNVNHDDDLKAALQPGETGTRVNFIVHTIQHVNQMLAERRFFFMDILKEGYLLFDSKRYTLARPPKELPPAVMLRHAEEYLAEWMDSADRCVRGAHFHLSDGGLKHAAFDLHQAAERYITGLLLVHTGYRPKEHDMEKLFQQAAGFDPRFAAIFPNDTEQEKHLFDLLRRAYVDARYSKSYRITEDELHTIGARIGRLKDLIGEVCSNKIDALRKAADIPQQREGHTES